MADRAVTDRPAQAHHRSGPVFDLIAAKLRRPATRPGAIRRSSLIEKLARAGITWPRLRDFWPGW
jgi:hypothetical protein